jgi:N-acyl homoserine lactone hydrolase
MNFIKLASAAVALFALGTPAKAMDMRLWRLDCGTIQVNDLNLFSDTYGYPGATRRFTDSCYLIQHGTDYMLWDTGLPAALLGKPIGKDPMSPTLTQTLATQLGQIGVQPDQISMIGISHYHFDHVGQAATFPKAKLMIGKADLDAMKSKPLPFGAQRDLLGPWLDGQAPSEAVSGDKDVFGDGSVTMLAMPGHTPGSTALLVKLPKTGPVLLSGDVVHFEAQLTNNYVPPFNTDRAASLASMDRLRGIVASLKATLVVQHDADDIGKLPAFPGAAE